MSQLGRVILLILSLISCESFAKQVDAIEAVIQSPQVKTVVPNITKIEIINVYHCPDCYDIQVTGQDDIKDVSVTLRTEANDAGQIILRLR